MRLSADLVGTVKPGVHVWRSNNISKEVGVNDVEVVVRQNLKPMSLVTLALLTHHVGSLILPRPPRPAPAQTLRLEFCQTQQRVQRVNR